MRVTQGRASGYARMCKQVRDVTLVTPVTCCPAAHDLRLGHTLPENAGGHTVHAVDLVIGGQPHRLGKPAVPCRLQHSALGERASDQRMVKPGAGLPERFDIEQMVEPAVLLFAVARAVTHRRARVLPICKAGGGVTLDECADLADAPADLRRL